MGELTESVGPLRRSGARPASFAHQSHAALDAIERDFKGRERGTALAVYVALTRVATDGAEPTNFRQELGEVARCAGVQPKRVRELVPDLERAGLLVAHRVNGDLVGWELREPPGTVPPTSSEHVQNMPSAVAGLLALGVPEGMALDAGRLLADKVRVGNRVVTAEEMARAAAALNTFNAEAGANYGLGAHLTTLVGRIRERPSMPAEQHVRLVQSAFRVRWWERNGRRSGRIKPNVIYGNSACFENVLQDAIEEANTGSVERPRGRFDRRVTRDV